MEAEDLMIGDWVECTYWKPSKRLRVAEIRRVMDDETKIGVYYDELVLVFKQREIEPIPLTPEILEKNGFKQDKYGNYLLEEDLGESEIWLYLQQTTSIADFWCTVSETVVRMNHVHQLQHALSLCGSEKQIII